MATDLSELKSALQNIVDRGLRALSNSSYITIGCTKFMFYYSQA